MKNVLYWYFFQSHFRPLISIQQRPSDKKPESYTRSKRSTCDPEVSCCKFEMTVSFEELGINEIFQPTSIRADYCYGSCNRKFGPDIYLAIQALDLYFRKKKQINVYFNNRFTINLLFKLFFLF